MKLSIRHVFAAVAMFGATAGVASAQTSFSVDPLMVHLNGQTNSAVLTITNPTAKEIRFEIKAYTWDQTPPDGAMVLADTKDVVIFPPLVTLKPKTTQRVRVGTTAAQGPIEKSYRIMVEELPTGDAPPVANQVAVRTRIGIPVFIEPIKATVSGDIGTTTIAGRVLSIQLKNTGTAHAMVDNVIVRGMAAEDQLVFEDALQGWYVLAGKTRTWQYTFRNAQCRPSKFIEIEVFANDKMLSKRVDVPAGACNP
jgi:fimbrial chaperone protein